MNKMEFESMFPTCQFNATKTQPVCFNKYCRKNKGSDKISQCPEIYIHIDISVWFCAYCTILEQYIVEMILLWWRWYLLRENATSECCISNPSPATGLVMSSSPSLSLHFPSFKEKIMKVTSFIKYFEIYWWKVQEKSKRTLIIWCN